jgi:RimJ/RimL family protein N-acetyltransferase
VILRLGVEGLGLHRVVALLERLGMRREAHLVENEFVKGEWTDEVIYAVLEWRG